jgi:hypothetical protein
MHTSACRRRARSRKNPLHEADFVMIGVVTLAVLGSAAYFLMKPTPALAATTPASSDPEPPFVSGT